MRADRDPARGRLDEPGAIAGPALVSGRIDHLWIDVIGPLIGGLMSVGLATLLHETKAHDRKAAEAAQGMRDGEAGVSEPPAPEPSRERG